VKLLEVLVDSVLLYGAEVWGSCGRAVGSYREDSAESGKDILGVGRLHPKVSLLFELNTLLLKWE